jgi:hypothetical protein
MDIVTKCPDAFNAMVRCCRGVAARDNAGFGVGVGLYVSAGLALDLSDDAALTVVVGF